MARGAREEGGRRRVLLIQRDRTMIDVSRLAARLAY